MKSDLKTLLENKELLIFDCDGVLFDSHDANVAYFDEALKLCGYNQLPRTYLNKAKYMSLSQLIDEIVDTEEEAREMYNKCIKLPYDPFITMLNPSVDFEKVFGILSSQYRCAIASNRGVSLNKLVKEFSLDTWFDPIVCTVDANPKPDPTMLQLCLEKTSIKNERAVFIGDAHSDYLAAQRASMDFIHVGEMDEVPCISSVDELILLV